MVSITEMALSGLKFDNEGLSKAAQDDDATGPALILIFFSSLLAGLHGFLNEDFGQVELLTSFVGVNLTGNAIFALIIQFLFQLFYLLLIGLFYSFSLRLFGGKASIANVVRIVGATSLWSVIGLLTEYFITGYSGIFTFIGFLALLYGVSTFSGKGMLVAFIALIVAFILMVIVLWLIVFFVFIAIFASLF